MVTAPTGTSDANVSQHSHWTAEDGAALYGLDRWGHPYFAANAQYGYKGRYQGVFPVKCNQQRHVVEQLVESGKRWHFGLEAGSKAELLICNGYTD